MDRSGCPEPSRQPLPIQRINSGNLVSHDDTTITGRQFVVPSCETIKTIKTTARLPPLLPANPLRRKWVYSIFQRPGTFLRSRRQAGATWQVPPEQEYQKASAPYPEGLSATQASGCGVRTSPGWAWWSRWKMCV